MTNEQRAKILAYVAERKHSYAVIGRLCGVTRNVVAGAVFRDRHPIAALVPSPNAQRSRNKTGKGWQPPSYRPEMTASDPR